MPACKMRHRLPYHAFCLTDDIHTSFRLLSPFATAAVLLAPAAVAQAAAPAALKGNAEAGKAAFRKCASCHQVGPSARGGFGPKLTGVIGRKAGATTDYKYSAAMKTRISSGASKTWPAS